MANNCMNLRSFTGCVSDVKVLNKNCILALGNGHVTRKTSSRIVRQFQCAPDDCETKDIFAVLLPGQKMASMTVVCC